jgi:uroporphyrinogen-III synthase
VTLMSQRTAHTFARLLAQAGVADAAAQLQAFCLSRAVAEPVEEQGWKAVHCAREATLASLVECIDNAFQAGNV